ncbi:MAG: hypothetical protein ACYDDF_13835 [Thermoplasmatota archaeon]
MLTWIEAYRLWAEAKSLGALVDQVDLRMNEMMPALQAGLLEAHIGETHPVAEDWLVAYE